MFFGTMDKACAVVMKRRRNPRPARFVGVLDVPVPPDSERLDEYLASRLGSKAAARRAIIEVAEEFGLPPEAPRNVSAALALTRLGADLGRIARSLAWDEFEDYCAMAISAAGYAVLRDVRLRRPRRQIDIVAESPTLVLSIDCKHWKQGTGPATLEAHALAQAERTRAYMESSGRADGRAFLPVLLTMVDNKVRVVDGVPVVPLHALREFLASVTRFEEGFSFIRAGRRD